MSEIGKDQRNIYKAPTRASKNDKKKGKKKKKKKKKHEHKDKCQER